MTPSEQWARVVSIVETATARSREIRDAHGAARAKLESADYALSCLVDDLIEVMTMPDANREAIAAAAARPGLGRSFEDLRRLDRADAARTLDTAGTA